ncbi:phenylalanine--tRNA ligase subunit beta [Ligilactobacillus sp. WILCCON 0076]|uniref:Phenylalanine--tRNA ligase beta subunit n=1 Tax=Ligilactobacillus ubinensis TaxID=2876789 RepID=A0A9X2FLG7_9LACO|nr:phenylalanine--tRNA ligase subunit beta [Ligilactobacillus ubinensis]MCP0887801.1 phenylalanine--tRNA ligase subunit beta [Ligilactobacillus ubinensis]
MKVSTKWLNEYVPVIDLDRSVLAEKIARTAVEVDDDYRLDEGLKKVVVGHVLSMEPHPDSDHLNICQVDVGEAEPYQIVCGAPNINSNMNVIVALPNSWIGNHTKIKKSKMRGIVSMGMICSLQELGFSDSVVPKKYADGIYILPSDAVPGQTIFSYLGMDENIIDIDITPNRADLLSMRGVANEIGAIYNHNVKLPHPVISETTEDEINNYLTKVSAPANLAPTYMMRIIKDVKIKESPLWLQARLWNAGIRPLNNVVDVTNYILLDYGQPLHSFDYNKMGSKQIIVRLANEGEELVTLDGEKRLLKDTDIVVTNGDKPVALAGVMGGLNTEIDSNSTLIALESAVFNPSKIRKTSRRENLHSEASMRFERGINVATVGEALDAAAQMIAELGDGQVVANAIKVNEISTNDRIVEITTTKINATLGTNLTENVIKDIFERLGFGVQLESGTFKVAVPVRRWDIEVAADLIEEVARLYGYDNLPTTLPTGPTTPGHYTDKQRLIRQTCALMESAGLSQAISYGLTTKAKAQRFTLEKAKTTELDFPMSTEHTTVRMNLVSGLLDDIAYNAAHKNNDVALYEQGRVFFRDDQNDRPREVEHLAGAITGLFNQATWHDSKTVVDFYLTKGIVDYLFKELGLENVKYVATNAHEEMHPGRTADIYIGGELVGFIGEVHPNILKEYHLGKTYVFELDLQKLIDMDKKEQIYQPISKYPKVTRDIAMAVDKSISNAAIIDCIKQNGGKYLTDVTLFDVYEGEHVAKSVKSLAYKLIFNNPEATLKDAEVTEAFNEVVEELKKKFKIAIR